MIIFSRFCRSRRDRQHSKPGATLANIRCATGLSAAGAVLGSFSGIASPSSIHASWKRNNPASLVNATFSVVLWLRRLADPSRCIRSRPRRARYHLAMVLHRHDSAPAALQLLFRVLESAGVVCPVVNRNDQREVLDLAGVE